MKHKFLATALLIFPALLCFAALIGLDGKWQGNITLPDGNTYPVTYEFTVNSGQLSGKASAEGSAKTLTEGKVNGADFSFSITDDDGQPIPHSGKYYTEGDSIALLVTYQGSKLHGSLKRAKN
ncbi:glycoside hydrolase [Spirosoma sp. HMF4905]|uniref:Glycoside hydrolase n=1 Tax=Spirosoma arboris TaxID=2682092 RepID=A0A7K1SBP7_9BACT|nr:glycoside hydrolase [Spirosoma arboris]MVM31243.1 glycoside hydrolase [Spirosoma arboris]